MALKDRDRTRPRRLVRSGIIRLGHREKRKRKDGSEYEFPVQDSHFVLTDAPEIAEVYGDKPRELDVILPFPDIARNFNAFYNVWAGGVLVCKGDGEYVRYAAPFRTEEKGGRTRVYNASGDTSVSDGQARIAFKWNGQEFKPGDLVPCSGAAQDLYPHCAACRMSAILKVMMAKPELIRCGYYQLATSSGRNYDTILGTLELISADGRRPVNGIPFKLRLVEEATTYVEKGKRQATKKWFVQLEPDPTLVRALYQQKAQALLRASIDTKTDPDTGEIIEATNCHDCSARPGEPHKEGCDVERCSVCGGQRLLCDCKGHDPTLARWTGFWPTKADEWGEVEPEAPPPFAEDGGPAEEPEAEAENSDGPRPYDPAQVRHRLRNNSKWVKGDADDFSDARRQPDDKQKPPDAKLVQRVAALIGKALARPEGGDTDLERHSVLGYLFGVYSAGLLTSLEASATAKWLEAPASEDGKSSWLPSGVASEECRLILRKAMKDAGQQEMELDKKSGPAEEPESENEDGDDPDLPVAWRAYANKAVSDLFGYRDIYHVIDVLQKAGISPVSDAAGDCAFNRADVWIVLSETDHADE